MPVHQKIKDVFLRNFKRKQFNVINSKNPNGKPTFLVK